MLYSHEQKYVQDSFHFFLDLNELVNLGGIIS